MFGSVDVLQRCFDGVMLADELECGVRTDTLDGAGVVAAALTPITTHTTQRATDETDCSRVIVVKGPAVRQCSVRVC